MSQTYDLGIRITADGRIMTAEVGRSQDALQQLGATAQQAGAQASAALGGVGNAAANLNASLNRTGVSAAQTAAALRGVPAQFTDIATSLAAGQAPLTVLLQQGGQLKDMFGGVGPAAKALGGYVAGLVNPLTLSAAAAVALGVAVYSASTETDEFKKNLILTGNVSGMTIEKFGNMSIALGNLAGVTRGAASEALTAMAASGNIGSESIQQLTAAALQMERAGGPAVAETVSQFEALGKKPVEASLELSSKTHYLTLAVYEQIKALQDQGKFSEAAALAQKAWADAISERAPKMVQDLGYLETAWDNLKRSASGVWDFLKEIGRDATQAEQIAELKTKIADADQAIAGGSINRNRLVQQKVQWAAELAELVASNKAKEDEDKRHAAEQTKNDASVKATAKYDKLIDDQKSKTQKRNEALQLLEQDHRNQLISEEKYQQAKAALQNKYEDKNASRAGDKAVRAAAIEQRRLDDLLAEGAGEAKTYAESMALLQKYALAHSDTLREGTPDLENYRAAVIRQIAAHTASGKAWHQSTEAAKEANHALGVWKAEHVNQLQAIAEETAAIGQSTEARKIALAVQQVKSDTEKKIAALSKKLSTEESEKAEKEIKQEGEKQQAAVKTALIKQQAIAGAYQLEQENRRFAADSIFDERARAQAILEIDADTWRERIYLAAEGSEERRRLETAFQQWYANQAAKPMLEHARKFADGLESTFHDVIKDIVTLGKFDFDALWKGVAISFKTQVADEIYKMTVGRIVVNVIGSFAGGAANAAGTAVAAGGNAAQQGLGIMSGVQGAWSAYNGGMASMASGFATSGAGQMLGLSTAGQVMGPPTAAGGMGWTTTGATMTGAGSNLAAIAGPLAAALAAAYTIAEMNKAGWGQENTGKGYATAMLTGGIGTNVVLDRLFGHNRKVSDDAAGIQGTIDLGGFSGANYQERSQKGGTFRSDRRWTDTSAVDNDMDAYLDSLVRQTVSGVQTVGKALGLETEKAMQGFSHSFQLQLTDNGSWDKAGEKIAGELGKVSDELATRLLPNIEEFRRYGETASQTLTRLNAEFAGTDAILQILGKTAVEAFGSAGMASADARERLIDIAGGMDQLATKTASFYQHYFTDTERTQQTAQAAQRQINEAFGALGIAVPKNTAEFKQLVIGQDLSTEAGARLFSQLLNLEGAFYLTTQAAADAKKTALGQQTGLFDRYATDAQKTAAAQGELNRVFGEFGRAVPKNSAEMVRLVQSLDPAVEADQRLLKALDGLTGAFDTVAGSATTAAEKQISAMQRVTAQMDQVASYKAGISSAQFDIRSKLPSFNAVGYYAEQGKNLRGQMAGASTLDQRLGLGEQLKTSILNRYQAEQDAVNKNRDVIKTDFDKRLQDQQALLRLQQQGAQNQLQASKQWNDALLRMREYANGLLLSDASPLSPEARLSEAARQYDAMLTRAKGGDADAAGQLQNNAQSYLAAARDYFASGTGYGAIFDQVQSSVAGLGASAKSPAEMDAAFQSQTLSFQQQSIALDTEWQQMWDAQSRQWQADDETLAQDTIDELDALQTQADAWNDELRHTLQEQAINGVRQTEYLSDVATNTKDLDIRIATAIAGAMNALQTQITALSTIQAKSSGDLVYLTEQTNELLYSLDRTTRLESV